jgi:hypothetical protein
VDTASCRLWKIDQAVGTTHKAIGEAKLGVGGSFARAGRRTVRSIASTDIDVEVFTESNYDWSVSFRLDFYQSGSRLLRSDHW